MHTMTGVVKTLANWYVPIALFCKERFVNTTNPQKEAERGNTCFSVSGLGLNMFNHTQI